MNLTIVFLLAGATVLNNNDLLNDLCLEDQWVPTCLLRCPSFHPLGVLLIVAVAPASLLYVWFQTPALSLSTSASPLSMPALETPWLSWATFHPSGSAAASTPMWWAAFEGLKHRLHPSFGRWSKVNMKYQTWAGQSLAECEPVVCPLGGVYWAWGEKKSFPVEKAQRTCSFAFLFSFLFISTITITTPTTSNPENNSKTRHLSISPSREDSVFSQTPPTTVRQEGCSFILSLKWLPNQFQLPLY